MPLHNLEESLGQMDDAFRKAPADVDPFAFPEPGVYQGVVLAIDFFERKEAPNDAFLKITVQIQLDPKYAGRTVDFVHPLEPHLTLSPERSEQKLSFLKKDLKTLGIDVEAEDFSLAAVRPGSSLWDDVLDAPVEIAVVDSKKVNPNTGKPYRNAYINERLGAPISDLGQPEVFKPEPTPAADIPF